MEAETVRLIILAAAIVTMFILLNVTIKNINKSNENDKLFKK